MQHFCLAIFARDFITKPLRLPLYWTVWQRLSWEGSWHHITSVFTAVFLNFPSISKLGGEAGTVKLKNKRSSKLSDCGVVCVFVGYARNHDSDFIGMWDPCMGSVHVSRDVVWLHCMFFSPPSNGLRLVNYPFVICRMDSHLIWPVLDQMGSFKHVVRYTGAVIPLQ